MKKILISFVIFFFLFNNTEAQVTFVIDSLPAYTPVEDVLYIAGDFQGWDPGNPDFALQKNNEEKWFIQLEAMPEGTQIQFKFTRGDWGKVEKGPMGEEIPNRNFTFGNGETVGIIIYNWADNGGGNSTAAENVHIVDEDFYMPQLDRYRKIWIYLPPGYETGIKHYPVIYMHDGQNLFDTYTSFAGEWEVDETLNEMNNQGYNVPIVVGINNGGTERVNEYTPWANSQYGGGQGGLYIDFIVETLKPFIDANYRTLPDRGSTGLWGSSLGGLISFYGALKYPGVFGKAGVFSPSYWFSDSVWTFVSETGYLQGMKFYQLTGSLEGGSMVADTWVMHDTLTSEGFSEEEIFTAIIQGGSHNEQLWKGSFGQAYLWLFQSFASGVDEHAMNRPVAFPFPVTTSLPLYELAGSGVISYEIITADGGCVMHNHDVSGNFIDVSGLAPGFYLFHAVAGGERFSGKFVKLR
ncbi:MAG: hypothetical protein JXA03_08385 [Bacteroidales bacterium]|nr:hypothetical protein [Bacteroidales bacterium]